MGLWYWALRIGVSLSKETSSPQKQGRRSEETKSGSWVNFSTQEKAEPNTQNCEWTGLTKRQLAIRLGESVWNSVDQTVLNRYSQIPVTLPVLKFCGVNGREYFELSWEMVVGASWNDIRQKNRTCCAEKAQQTVWDDVPEWAPTGSCSAASQQSLGHHSVPQRGGKDEDNLSGLV